MIRDLIKDMAEYLPSRLVPMLIGIISLPIISHLFPPADYGNYILAISTISILSLLTGWVGMSVIRFYPAYMQKGLTAKFTELVVKLILFTIIIISLISLLGLYVSKSFISNYSYHLIAIVLLIFVLNSMFDVLLNILRIKRKINFYSYFYIVRSIGSIVIGILLVVVFNFDITGLLYGTILASILLLPFLWKLSLGKLELSKNGLELTKSSFDYLTTIEMMKYSIPLVIGNLAAWVLDLSDRYVLGMYRGAYEVGIYSISYQVAEYSILFIISMYSLAFNPISMIIWEKDGVEASKKIASEGTRYFLLLCIPAMVGISVLRVPIIKLLSTPEYYEGSKIVPLIVFGIFLFGLTQRYGTGLSFFKKTHISMICIIISASINLGLNYLFIPSYGYIAAALSTLISYAFLLIMMIVLSRRFFIWAFPFKSLLRITCASTLMGFILYYIDLVLSHLPLLDLIVGIPIGMTSYFIFLFLLNEFKRDELKGLQKIKIRSLSK